MQMRSASGSSYLQSSSQAGSRRCSQDFTHSSSVRSARETSSLDKSSLWARLTIPLSGSSAATRKGLCYCATLRSLLPPATRRLVRICWRSMRCSVPAEHDWHQCSIPRLPRARCLCSPNIVAVAASLRIVSCPVG